MAGFDQAAYGWLFDDPGLKLLGYRRGMEVRGWEGLSYSAAVAGILLTTAFILKFIFSIGCRGAKLTDSSHTPAPEDVPKQASFCLIGVFIHAWLGRVCLYASLAGENMPALAAAGNREALAKDADWKDLYNVYSLCGEFFAGYAMYITVMWLLQWEKGVDKIIHHMVFLTLGVTLAGSGALGRLSSRAMAMELTTVFLNSAMMAEWFQGGSFKMIKMVCGGLFVLSFIIIRIFFFGRAVYLQWSEMSRVSKETPLPENALIACVVMYTAGWVIQVYWLMPIAEKVKDTFFKSKSKAH
eukprot:Hpha_TRINITY_DN15465_c3_g10::TRINITY_DN15465_c3_g10_i1::g.175200::m.175200